jgi:hypothetical protein
MSRTTRDMLALAAGMAEGAPVDATMVLLAAFRHSHESGHAGVADELLNVLAHRQNLTSDDLIGRLNRVTRVRGTGAPITDPRFDEPPLSLLLGIAAGVAERVSGSREVHSWQLVTATVLATEPPLRPEFLAELKVSADELRRLLAEAALSEVSAGALSEWQELLVDQTPVSGRLAGGMSTDRVDPNLGIPQERDYLGTSMWVSMLATVMADRDTPMPLSLGIFGEWGSGKSYFMGLLREEVDRRRNPARNRICGT